MKRACGCSYGGVALGEKYLNTNFEAVQIVAANLEAILALVDSFESPNGTIANAGSAYELQLDVDVAKLNDVIQDATAPEMAAVNDTTFAYLSIGGTIKKVPLSVLGALFGNRVVEGSVFGLTPRKGDMWWDTDNEVLLIFVGGRWIDVSSTIPPAKWTEDVTPPLAPNGGDRWYDTVNSLEFVYIASLGTWVQS
jgi:hypothetical protein